MLSAHFTSSRPFFELRIPSLSLTHRVVDSFFKQKLLSQDYIFADLFVPINTIARLDNTALGIEEVEPSVMLCY
jgi:hypothetical protein